MQSQHTQSDAGVFIHTASNGNKVIAMIYVDDTSFMGSNLALVKEKKQAFMAIWECHDLGTLKSFLASPLSAMVESLNSIKKPI